MRSCRDHDLDAFVLGELSPEEESSVTAHLATCAACRQERAWLRAERRLFADRSRRSDDALPAFEAVLVRATVPSPASSVAVAKATRESFAARFGRPAAQSLVALAAAAAFVGVVRSGQGPERATVRATPSSQSFTKGPPRGTTWSGGEDLLAYGASSQLTLSPEEQMSRDAVVQTCSLPMLGDDDGAEDEDATELTCAVASVQTSSTNDDGLDAICADGFDVTPSRQ